MQTKATKKPNRRLYPRVCEQCGATFQALPPNKRRTQRLCSVACARLAHRSRIPLTCQACGKAFERTPFKHAHAVHVACSKRCSDALEKRPTGERLAQRTNLNGPIPAHAPDLGPCHEWAAGLNSAGYGQIMMLREDGKYRPDRAHRVAWVEASGDPIPDGMIVCHACDNPKCLNTEGEGVWLVNGVPHRRLGHLFLGSLRDNSHDMVAKGRASLHRAVLTHEDVVAIKQRYAAGERVSAIARAYPKVRHQQISRIVRGERWRTVA